MKTRIVGIDVARAIALIGMIVVNFKTVFGDAGSDTLKSIAQLLDGKAAAIFVVLAGVGIALMTKSAIVNNDQVKLRVLKLSILKKALFLFIVGLSYIAIWPADILHFYGVYMLIAMLFISQSTTRILIATAAFILLFPVLLVFINYESGWNFETLTYLDLWSVDGFIRNLFFNGFHPVAPWTAFILFGLWYGRQDLYSDAFLKKSLFISAVAFVMIQMFSHSMLSSVAQHGIVDKEIFEVFFGLSPMPPMPMYMINGLTLSVAVISACIWLSRRFSTSVMIDILSKTGKLALTFYVAHVIIGMGVVETLGDRDFGEYTIQFSLMVAVGFSLACIVFASVWLRYFKVGPLEYVMRRLTS